MNTEEQITFQHDEESPLNVIVDIKGAVKYPGVYELTTEQRIIDVIELAGGYTNDANSKDINHAQKVQDEMVIYIPKMGEIVEETEVDSFVSIPSSESSTSQININTATESELTTLPGIGPSKAQAILTYREENGRFQTVDDLKKVSGIGEKTFEKLKEFITVK